MKKLLLGGVVGILVGLAVARMAWHPASADAKTELPAKAEEKPKENPLHLPASKRTAAGITLVAPEKRALAPEVDAYGRVLDPTPYVTLVAEEATARASLTASEKELARVQKLFAAGGNASAQAVETAEAAAVKDRAAVASAHLRLLAGWGERLAHADITQLTETVAKGATLLRIDLLPGSAAAADLETARVSLLGSTETFTVTVLGAAPVADPQVQGASYLALLRGHSLPAGAVLHVILPGSGASEAAMILPLSAIVYHQGSPWIYVLGEEDTFERKLVELGRNLGDDVVVLHGVDAADQVVSHGAGQLLSAELQTGGASDAD